MGCSQHGGGRAQLQNHRASLNLGDSILRKQGREQRRETVAGRAGRRVHRGQTLRLGRIFDTSGPHVSRQPVGDVKPTHSPE